MKIKRITVQNHGYVYCKSNFYSVHDILTEFSSYTFSTGINKLIGEIDSGNWAISYLLSMYKYYPERFILFDKPQVTVNNELILLNDLSDYSCYMDDSYPLFSSDCSVKSLIIQGLEQSKTYNTYYDIKNIFDLDEGRIERPLKQVGNEAFRAMSAIGYSYGKEVFCFPWLSNQRFSYLSDNITRLLQILNDLGRIVILPLANKTADGSV